MHITVISDSHGNYRVLEQIILRCDNSDWFIHLGDGERDLDRFLTSYPQYSSKILHVCGNCDFSSLSQQEITLPVSPSHRIFATHGHRYDVKSGLEPLKNAARSEGCDIVLYGHTHVRDCKYEDGLYILNPGSITAPHDGLEPSFGSIDIAGEDVILNITPV